MAYPYFNATNFTGFFIYLNEVTNNWFGHLMLIVIGAVSFLSLKTYTTDRAFLASSFITTLATVFFATAKIVPFSTVMIMIIISALALVNAIFTKPQGIE